MKSRSLLITAIIDKVGEQNPNGDIKLEQYV